MKIIYANTVGSIWRSNPEPDDIVMTGVKGRNAPGSRVVVDTDPYTDELVLRPEWCAPRAESDENDSMRCSPFKLENMTPGAARLTGYCRFCRWNRSRRVARAADAQMLRDLCDWQATARSTCLSARIKSEIGPELYKAAEHMQRINRRRGRYGAPVFLWRRMRHDED